MSVLSHLPQLFNAEQCPAYIHTLRWKERPLQWPRCQSHHSGRWGTYQYRPGYKRYWCPSGKHTFNDLTDILWHQSQRSLVYWILATFLVGLTCASRRIAREVGIRIRTSYRWGWWRRHAALSYEMQRQLEGTVEADELYHAASQKGQAKGGEKSTWDAARVGAARNASRARDLTTKTDRRLSPGAVARRLLSAKRPAISPSRPYKRRLTSPCTRTGVFTQTRRVAIGPARLQHPDSGYSFAEIALFLVPFC